MAETLEQHTAALESVLQQQVQAHEALLSLLERRRQAMRTADTRAVNELCALENEKVQAISELEKQRLTLVAKLTLAIDPTAAEPMRMGELAERLPEPARGRLLVLRHQLMQRMARVREASSVARRAAEALMKHVHGLVQTIGVLSTGVSTYSQQGQPPRQATAVSTINLTA